jgi:ATP-dependent DNA helicase RecQ
MLGCDRISQQAESTNEGKAKRLKTWTKEGILVATANALGLVDVPDVRLVVHADMPTHLRDDVEESGRAGRDGNCSEAIVVCRKTPQDEKPA